MNSPLCLANLKTCCAASKLAYAQTTLTDAASGESVLIQDCGDCTVIAFPGTHDLHDVLRDLECLRVPATILGQPCSVHAGFHRAHNALIAQIISGCAAKEALLLPLTAVVSPSPRGDGRGEGNRNDGQPIISETSRAIRSPIFLTGHSKGAAVARRCALALIENNIPVTGLITFGEPRGGDARYARICDAALGGGASVLASQSLRITNAADPVPWIPAWFAGNRHCGPEAWFPRNTLHGTRNTELIISPRLWWQLLQNSLEIFRAWRLRDLAPLADHHIDNYLARINAL